MDGEARRNFRDQLNAKGILTLRRYRNIGYVSGDPTPGCIEFELMWVTSTAPRETSRSFAGLKMAYLQDGSESDGFALFSLQDLDELDFVLKRVVEGAASLAKFRPDTCELEYKNEDGFRCGAFEANGQNRFFVAFETGSTVFLSLSSIEEIRSYVVRAKEELSKVTSETPPDGRKEQLE